MSEPLTPGDTAATPLGTPTTADGAPAPDGSPPRQAVPPAPEADAPSTSLRPASSSPAPRRRHRRELLLAALVVLLLALVGGAIAYTRYQAPAAAMRAYCADLVARSYTDAYSMLSAQARATLTVAQFTQAAQAADHGEGPVRACGASARGGYSYLLGSGHASMTITITRTITRAGAQPSTGTLRLVAAGGAWRVGDLGPTLLGMDLGALQATMTYCAAARTQNYAALYRVQSNALHQGVSVAQYIQVEQLRAALDGPVTTCTLTSIGTGNSATRAQVELSITRQRQGTRQGTLTLDDAEGVWKVSAISSAVRGTDLGALLVGERFCDDIGSGDYADAIALFAPAFRGSASAATFSAIFAGSSDDIKYIACAPIISSYSATGTTAALAAMLTVRLLATGASASGPITLGFTLAGGVWQLSAVQTSVG